MALNNLDFLKPGEEWPPKSEKERLKRYGENRKLFEVEHEEVFKETWARVMRWEDGTSLELVLDWPKRLSTLWADLLAGDPPTFTVGEEDSPEQTQLDEIVERNEFPQLIYELGIDMSRLGDGLIKLRKEDGKAVIEGVQPDYWFPVTAIGSPRTIKAHVLAWEFEAAPAKDSAWYEKLLNTAPPTEKMKMLKVEIHRKGEIEHRVLAVGKDDKISHVEPVVAHFEDEIGRGVRSLSTTPDDGVIEKTTIDDEFLVQHAPGLRAIGKLHGIDDYKSAEGLVQEMEARLAQISRILDKHADPSMYGPASAVVYDRKTGKTEFIGGGKYYPVYEDEEPPGYIVWDAQLTNAFDQLDKLLEAFYNVTETSPAAFGQIDAGLATSGTALRRLMQAPLAKTRRLRNLLNPVVRKTLKIAARLENGGQNIGYTPEEDDDKEPGNEAS